VKDLDVRAATLRELRARHNDDTQTRIVEEMGIWSGSVRIDIAVINGELQGYELKSHRDTLERLPAQAELYSQIFDRITLVVAGRHLNAANSKIPDWWGIKLAYPAGLSEVSLQEIRPANANPEVNPALLARLLWRVEALAILKRLGVDRGVRSRPTGVVACRVVESLSLDQLRFEVRETLKNRVGWLGQPVSN